MKRIVCAVAAMALVGAVAAAGAAPAPDAKQITARGCVQAGVEHRCLVLKDVESGKLFELLIKGAGPDIGTGIEFTGKPYGGTTACMQGSPVQVTSWTPKHYLKCSRNKVREKTPQAP
jgi:hypothetical protein